MKKLGAPKETPTQPAGTTRRASPAEAADGDAPVFAYIASLPEPERAIVKHIDALAAKTLPNLERSVKWRMAYYGVAGGFCFSAGAFAGHVKLMFIRGTDLTPVPPVTPTAMGKSTRGVDFATLPDIDDTQVASWMRQAATMPFISAARRKRGER